MKNPTKHILFTTLLAFLSILIFAQSPNAIKYQGVVNDASGNLLKNQAVGFQFKVHDGSTSGPVIYTETHSTNTNDHGVVTLEIGQGSTSDALSSINWESGSKFLEILIDISGGSSYSSMGSFQLVSVPYALYANKAGTVKDNSISSSSLKDNSVTTSKIVDDAVTLEKIDDSGASTGEVLMFDGSNLTWSTVASSSGDITEVEAGNGLSGGGTEGNVTLEIGAGTGITVNTDDVALNTSYTDGRYVNENQSNSVSNAMLDDGAVTTNKISNTGASSGQVLTYNGTDVTWATPATTSGNTLDQAYDEGGAGAGRTINATNGAVYISGTGGLVSDGNISVGTGNTSDDDAINFDFATGPEQIVWDNSETKFRMTDDLRVDGTIGNASTTLRYNTFYDNGTAYTPTSGDMGNEGDVHIEFDLEVGQNIYVGGRLAGNVPGISQGRLEGTTTVNNISTMADIVTTTITTPGTGYIMVEAQGQLGYYGITTANFIRHQIDETSGGTYDANYYRYIGASQPPNSSPFLVDICNKRTYYKAAGTYTFRWEALANTTSGSRYIRNPIITATYIPTAHGTVTSAVPASEAGNFTNKTAISPPEIGSSETGKTELVESEQYYQVDLKELQDKDKTIDDK